MKAIRWVLGLCLILAIAGGGASYFTPYPRIWVQTCGLNLGLIQIKDADWGFLKLRAGQAGLDALRDLERHGATDNIRQVSVAVQEQWLEAGHVTHQFMFGDTTQEKETRFSELRMPLDGKTLRQDLLPGQHIPDTFWQTQRYRLNCMLPPRKGPKAGECGLSMANVTGDASPEILLDTHIIGTWDSYIKPVIRHGLAIYSFNGKEWNPVVTHMRLCPAEQASVDDDHIQISNQRLDMLWLNGHAVNFFDIDCYHENAISNSARDLMSARNMASILKQIPVLPPSRPMPSSLVTALANRTIILPSDGGPPERDMPIVRFNGLPPCFTALDSNACVAIIAEIDHDGSDDAIIIDRDVRPGTVTYRLATLMMLKQGRWSVIGSHAVCANEGEKLERLKVELKPADWRSIEFAGRLYVPSDDSDSCTSHMPIL